MAVWPSVYLRFSCMPFRALGYASARATKYRSYLILIPKEKYRLLVKVCWFLSTLIAAAIADFG